MKKFKKWYEQNDNVIRLVLTIISGAALLASLILGWTGNQDILPIDVAWIAIVACGTPILVHAVIGVIKDHDITADVLVSMALIGALILNEWFAAGEVAFIMQIGSILEDFTSAKAKSGIEKLMKLSPKTARVVVDGKETVIPVEDVRIQDVLLVLAGETVPVDGVVLSGTTTINQATITGESMPVDKAQGDSVISGTINQFGTFTFRATQEEKDSSIQRMIKLAQEADIHKAKIVKKADRWATWLVILAFTTALLTGIIVGLINRSFGIGFERAVTVLVVFCPCAFILATPTAIMAGIGKLTKKGIIVRSGDGLERIAECTYIAFDKTGTLTTGTPQIIGIETRSMAKNDLLRIAAIAEKHSEHPLGKAIVASFKEEIPDCEDFTVLPGNGVSCKIQKKTYTVGKYQGLSSIKDSLLMKRSAYDEQGATVVYVCEEETLIGFIALSDTIRETAQASVNLLKTMGMTPVLFTGDNERSAQAIARKLGIVEYRANLLPEEKMQAIQSYADKGFKICMVGDGVNDALALKTAYAGIAMGGIGSDVAVEASDAILVNDTMDVVPSLFATARKTLKKINTNIIISLFINFFAVVCSVMGWLGPVEAAIVHNFGSVFVVLNSLLLLFENRKKRVS